MSDAGPRILRQHARRRAAVGDSVVLTCMWSEPGAEPESGDILETATGRRYLILEVRGRRLACVVVDDQATTSGQVLRWEWASRERRRTA